MSKQISPKLISLTFSILVVSFAITFYAFSWEEPPDPPPGGGVYPPVHIGPDSQTKEGDLALKNLYLNATGAEGSIYNIQDLVGYDDIFIKGNFDETASVYLAGSDLRFYTGAAERMIIDSSGDVGIGTTSPTQKLHVVGNARITGLVGCDTIDTDASGNFSCGTDAGGGTYTNIYAGTGVNVSDIDGPTATLSFDCSDVVSTGLACSGEDIYIQTSYRGAEARCGVTSFLRGDGACRTPANIVSDGGGGASQDVFRTINAPLGSDPVADSSTDTLNLSAGSGISITGNSATDTITIASLWTDVGAYIRPNNYTSFAITDTGRVGIGTTSPTYKLEVAGDIGIDFNLYHNNDDNTRITFSPDNIRLRAGGVSLLFLYEGAQDYVTIGNVYGGDIDIHLNDDMFVQGSSGNIGIGTISPTRELDVNGDIVASGTICDSGGANCIGGGGDNLGDHTATQNLNMDNNKITNITTPTADSDSATKGYVDAQVGAVGSVLKIVTDAPWSTGCPTASCGAGWQVIKCGVGTSSVRNTALNRAVRVFHDGVNGTGRWNCGFYVYGAAGGLICGNSDKYNALMVLCAKQ